MAKKNSQAESNDFALWDSLVPERGSPPRESDISLGLWRYQTGKTAIPVMTYMADDGAPYAQFGEKIIHKGHREWGAFTTRVWPRLKAVSREEYELATEEEEWPDGLKFSLSAYELSKGDNSPPEDPDAISDSLAEKVAELVKKATAIIDNGAGKTQTEVDKASNLANELIEVEKKVNAEREEKKRPYLEKGRAIDTNYNTVREQLKGLTRDLKQKVAAPFLLAERERQRKEEAKRRAEIEKETRQAAIARGETLDSARAEGRAVASAAKVATKVAAGTSGRSVGLQTVTTGIVKDKAKFALWLIENNHEGFANALQTFANDLARKKIFPAGIEKVEQSIAR